MGNHIKAWILGAVLCGILLPACTAEDVLEGEKDRQEAMAVNGEPLVIENEEEQGLLQEEEQEFLRFIDAYGEWYETEINPAVKKHNYDWSCLVNTETDLQYTGDTRYFLRKGVDVSEYQGNVDWERVKAAGYDFAILRIGYRGYGTEGALCTDTAFQRNLENAQNAGIEAGAYLFSQAVNEEEALEEAQFVLDNLEGHQLELPVVYDPERIRDDDARTDAVAGEQFTQNTIAFCEKIKESGYQPMIYCNMVWEAFELDMEKLAGYPVWYADYEKVPQTPYDFTYWQYTEKGHVDGIEGEVDLNVWFCRTE